MTQFPQGPGTPPPTPAQAPALPGPSVAFDALLAQEAALQQQALLLQAQRREVTRLTRTGDAAARSAAQAQVGQLNVEITGVQSQLASVQAQITARLSTRMSAGPGGRLVPARPPGQRDNGFSGDNVALIFIVFTLAVLMPLALGITRRLWRRTTAAAPAVGEDNMIAPRLDRLEQAVDAIAIEIERISEGQRFVTKVMTERPATVRQAEAAEANDAASLGQAKPFLALGAGPMEPIPVAQRQAVRQSITPH